MELGVGRNPAFEIVEYSNVILKHNNSNPIGWCKQCKHLDKHTIHKDYCSVVLARPRSTRKQILKYLLSLTSAAPMHNHII